MEKKKMKTRKGDDGYSYPYTTPDLVVDETGKSAAKKFDEISSQLKDIANRIDGIIITGGGLTTEQITALDNMFKVCAYTKDVSTEYNAFKTAFGIGSESGGNTPVTEYTINNNLTNCTNSNSNTSIQEGSSYSAILSATEGYILGTPIITMDDVDVTSTVYSDGTITIESVTGNIVITCTATQETINESNFDEVATNSWAGMYNNTGSTAYKTYQFDNVKTGDKLVFGINWNQVNTNPATIINEKNTNVAGEAVYVTDGLTREMVVDYAYGKATFVATKDYTTLYVVTYISAELSNVYTRVGE